jgi:3-hydroxyisobutyrate dehydrogenase
MAAGPYEVFQRVTPLLSALGKDVSYFGDSGGAATMKLVLNMLMGVEMQALAEAVLLGQQAGLSREVVLQAIAASGFSSPVMRFKCKVMERERYSPADFRLALMKKDMALVSDEARRLQVPMPAAGAAHDALAAAVRDGFGEMDCAAILPAMESALPGRPAAQEDEL